MRRAPRLHEVTERCRQPIQSLNNAAEKNKNRPRIDRQQGTAISGVSLVNSSSSFLPPGKISPIENPAYFASGTGLAIILATGAQRSLYWQES